MALKALSGTVETPLRSRSLSRGHSNSESEPDSETEPIVREHSSILFRKGNDLFALDPTDPSLQSRLILSHTSSINNMQFTKDKQHVYFKSQQHLIHIIDVASRSVIGTLDLPNFNSGWFVLKKPDLEEVLYVAHGGNGAVLIRQYRLDSGSTRNFGHSCGPNVKPLILAQTSDGSGLIYSCGIIGTVYLKSLNNGHDTVIYNNTEMDKIIVAPDNRKLLLYEDFGDADSDRFHIIDLFDEQKVRKSVRFGLQMPLVAEVAFSDDGTKVHVLYRNNINSNFELATFDYEAYINSESETDTMELISNNAVTLPIN